MRAVVLDDSVVRFADHHPEPQTRPGETLVRVLGAGICETDLQLIRGYMGFRGTLGHEFVGVAEGGPWNGRRVVGEINCVCGTCGDCREGRRNHCPNRTVLGIANRDGAFADFVSLPQENLHLVPDDVSDFEAVFVEPLAAAFRIPEQITLGNGQEAIVLGDGRLGNLCAQVLRVSGCRVTVVGKHERKSALLASLGIATAKLDDFRERRCAEVVVDCTGSATGLPLALEVVRPRGTVILKTTVAGEHSLTLAPVVIDEVAVIGSRCGPFARALEALKRREVDVATLCDGVVPLDQALSALERVRTQPVLKLLLSVDERFGGG